MTETYREEQEANYAEASKKIFDAVGHEDLEDKEEHEHDREADEESDYQCDEMIYN